MQISECSGEDMCTDHLYEEGLHEECGVFGVYDLDGGDVASTIYMVYLPFSTADRRAAALP